MIQSLLLQLADQPRAYRLAAVTGEVNYNVGQWEQTKKTKANVTCICLLTEIGLWNSWILFVW